MNKGVGSRMKHIKCLHLLYKYKVVIFLIPVNYLCKYIKKSHIFRESLETMADKSIFGSNDEYEKNNISNYDAYRKAC